MQKMDEVFLQQQITLGKKSVFISYGITGMCAKEFAYVISHGIWTF